MGTSLEIMKYSNLADAGYGQGLTPLGWEILKTISKYTAFRAKHF